MFYLLINKKYINMNLNYIKNKINNIVELVIKI